MKTNKRTILRLKGSKKRAYEFRRLLWRAIRDGEQLPKFKVDYYCNEILLIFYGEVEITRIKEIIYRPLPKHRENQFKRVRNGRDRHYGKRFNKIKLRFTLN